MHGPADILEFWQDISGFLGVLLPGRGRPECAGGGASVAERDRPAAVSRGAVHGDFRRAVACWSGSASDCSRRWRGAVRRVDDLGVLAPRAARGPRSAAQPDVVSAGLMGLLAGLFAAPAFFVKRWCVEAV